MFSILFYLRQSEGVSTFLIFTLKLKYLAFQRSVINNHTLITSTEKKISRIDVRNLSIPKVAVLGKISRVSSLILVL